jgi:hypothetical protein
MIEAGIEAMYSWYASTEPPEAAVVPIYEAMERARCGRNTDKA